MNQPKAPAERSQGIAPRHSLEVVVTLHLAGLAVFTAWAFGGNAYWSRMLASVWASAGIGLTILACFRPRRHAENKAGLLRNLWPLACLNGLVALSCLNPSFRALAPEVDAYLAFVPPSPFLPSSARPDLALRSLWFFDAVYLSCFNLLLVVRHRAVLRGLFAIVLGSAVLLAVGGTVQKLLGAAAPFFDPEPASQPFFFASFLYHNHWGAYTLLMVGLAAGLVLHYERHPPARGFWHSPGFTALLAIVLLAVTVPLSGSRSSTILLLLLVGLLLQAWKRVRLRSSVQSGRLRSTLAVAALVLLLAGGSGFYLARPMVAARLATTRHQVEQVRTNPSGATRVRLYQDTWRMAAEQPWFGWGLGSYPSVFSLYNTQRLPHPLTHPDIELNFRDAHSDWLQSLAELGWVGTTLVGFTFLVPLWTHRRRIGKSWLAGALLTGVAIVLLLAAVEFPFGNGAVVVAFWLSFFSAIQYSRCDPE